LEVIGILEDERAEGERDAMLAEVGVVFLRIEFKTQSRHYVFYTVSSRRAETGNFDANGWGA